MASKKEINDIKRKYLKFVRKEKRLPKTSELRVDVAGITRNAIRYHFGSVEALRDILIKENPKVFAGLINESVFNEKAMADMQDRVDKRDVVVVSTAVAGAPVHVKFQKALEHYTSERLGELLYIPVADPAADGGFQLDPKLGLERIVYADLRLNDNLYINTIKMSAKQVDPTTGLNRLSHKRSFIFGSPKQRMVVKPNAKSHHPHIFMGTGAVTKPNYSSSRYMSHRLSYLADADHVMGATVVEFGENDRFYYRQIQAAPNGSFADYGKMYHASGKVEKYAPDYFIMGDLHVGDHDEEVLEAWHSVIQETGAKNIVVHDGVNGHSISHHVEGRIIEKARESAKGRTSLADEGRECAQVLSELLESLPSDGKIYMAASNHDDFIYRYLNNKRFIHDHENLSFVAEHLLPRALRGENPAQVLVEHFLSENDKRRIVWWKLDEDVRHAGVLLSAHGDLGPNGSRGTIRNHSESYGPCVIGHCVTEGHSVNVKGKGWTAITEVSEGDIVLGYDSSDNRNSWVETKETHKYKYSGMLLEVGHNLWKQRVTDQHMMFTSDGKYVSILDAIRDTPLSSIPVTANPVIELNEYPIEDSLLKLIIAICADGHFGSRCKELRFHLKKQRKIDRLVQLFKDNGETVQVRPQVSGSVKIGLSKSSPLYLKICDLIDVDNKRLPEWMRLLSTRQKEVLLAELPLWDGHKCSKNGRQFSSKQPEEANLVQSIVNELGYRSSLITQKKARKYDKGYVVTYSMNRDNPISKRKKDGALTNWSVIPYKVENIDTYCLTTSSSNFWIRHDESGTVSLTGNSHTPGIFRDAYQVGTTTPSLPYAKGASSWMNTSCLLYANGSRQLINVIENEWRKS